MLVKIWMKTKERAAISIVGTIIDILWGLVILGDGSGECMYNLKFIFADDLKKIYFTFTDSQCKKKGESDIREI